ncbi:MAG: hypothetical protein II859_04735 [Bacteroidales bacterium]|nr:hypothetical protein [Bacteroidales bacterium]
MENTVYTESAASTTLPRLRKKKPYKRETLTKQSVPAGYMSLQQFEKELVNAVVLGKRP